MNLWFRLLLTLIKCLFVKKDHLLDSSELTFRVLPFDCDINIHLTNSRYLAFMDLGRLYLIAHKKNLFRTMLRHRWQPIISGIEIKFIKPVKPFSKIKLRTRLLTWDERYLYLEQRFFDNNKLYAIALIKGTFIEQRERVPMSRILTIIGEPQTIAPPMPLVIKHWQALTEAKKTSTESLC